jgi:hypothetical protein
MSWLDAVGWIGSVLLVVSVMQARVLRFRVLNLLACVVLTGFNAALGIWPMVAMNIALTLINLWHLRALVGTRHDDAAYDVIEVGPDDEYLRHVLRVHGQTSSPSSRTWSGTAPLRGGRRSSSSAATRPSASCWCATTVTASLEYSWTTSRRDSATSPPASSCGDAATSCASAASPAW